MLHTNKTTKPTLPPPKASSWQKLNSSILLVVSTIGAIWGLTVAILNVVELQLAKEEAQRKERDELVADMSADISKLRYNCANSFGPITLIPDSTSIRNIFLTQARFCHEAYQGVVNKIYATGLLLKRPKNIDEKIWSSAWEVFHKEIYALSSNPYSELVAECSWRNILLLLNYQLPGFTSESCSKSN